MCEKAPENSKVAPGYSFNVLGARLALPGGEQRC